MGIHHFWREHPPNNESWVNIISWEGICFGKPGKKLKFLKRTCSFHWKLCRRVMSQGKICWKWVEGNRVQCSKCFFLTPLSSSFRNPPEDQENVGREQGPETPIGGSCGCSLSWSHRIDCGGCGVPLPPFLTFKARNAILVINFCLTNPLRK